MWMCEYAQTSNTTAISVNNVKYNAKARGVSM